MKKRLIGLTLVALMTMTSFTGCSSGKETTTQQPSGTTSTSSKDSIEIAVVCTSLTGSLATNGDYMMDGVNMALEEINAAGGINGKTLKATFLDDQVKSSEAINAVKKAVDQMKVPVIIGDDSSGLVLADMPYAAAAAVPQIVSGTNIRITNQGVKTIFRMRASDATAAKILGEYVVKEGHKKVAFMYTNEDYGKGFMQSTEIILKGLGAQTVDSETANIGDTDFTAQILKIKNSGADSLLVLGKEVETAKFLRQAKQLGLKVATYGGSPLSLDYVLNLAGADALDGVKIVTHFLPQDSDPVVSEFVKKYEAKYKIQPSTHSVCYYDATKLVAEVMKKYGTTKEEIAKGLHEIEYTGVQSKFKADATGEMVTKQVIGEFKNGTWSVVDRIQ
jgi:branched-chain amino acid transport system substrate-binding protein